MPLSPSTRRPPAFDRSRQAAPQVFERLREQILSLEMAPGTVLSRADLASQFGLSQTPIRDALIKLGEEGLVDIFPQHATVVSRIDVASAEQAQFLRRSIESEVVRTLAAEADEGLIARLRAQVDVQAALMGSTAYQEFIAADRAFHQLMYEAAGVPDLYELVRRRSGHLDRLRMLNLPTVGKQRAILRDHRRIVEAIAKGDAQAAQDSLREHLSGTLSQIEDIRRAHPGYFTAG
jgi:DNA-binding GntR family transcriptional regulator